MVMKDSYLVQRLLRPRTGVDGSTVTRSHHVFGGGMLGMTPEQWAMVDPIFEIDYMGAAEYEFGIFPRTISDLWQKRASLIGFHFELKKKYIPPEWRRRNDIENAHDKAKRVAKALGLPAPRKPRVAARQDRDVYVLCAEDIRAEVQSHVEAMVGGKFRHKEGPRFDVFDSEDETERLEGWLDLNNQFFFFLSRQMWENACGLFGLVAAGDVWRVPQTPLQEAIAQG